jgi:BirA family biotin operon repressor/biotin-[acetyl-CoA-carboxylase] ligase
VFRSSFESIVDGVSARRFQQNDIWHNPCNSGYNQAMLQEARLRASLPVGRIGRPLYVFPSLGSTNDHAKKLAVQGAPHGTLVTADEQTAGRGRGRRRWLTRKGSGLAISLVLRQTVVKSNAAGWLSGLGALAVVEGLERAGLSPKIKWPNDVLLDGRKVAGVLAEAVWQGELLEFVVMGIGVNVREASLPREEQLDFPSTYTDAHSPEPIDREELLIEIVRGVGLWVDQLGTQAMLQRWQERLAFFGEEVVVLGSEREIKGTIVGLNSEGCLVVRTPSTGAVELGAEAMSIRPVDRLLN